MSPFSRKRKILIAALVLLLVLICAIALLLRFRGITGRVIGIDFSRTTGMADQNYYGFVHYSHYAGMINWPNYLEKVRAVGADWIQAEGPETASCSISWDKLVPWEGDCDPENAPDLEDPDVYQWESLAWVNLVAGQGMGAVIDISPGGGLKSESCWTKECHGGVCPPKDEHWGQWYKFVHHVVEHFDGTREDEAGQPVPEVKYFTSVEEAGESMPLILPRVPFYGGSVEDLLGARLDRTDPRNPQILMNPPVDVGGTRAVPVGIVPVAHLAAQEANPQARYVLGTVVGAAAKFANVHLYTEWVNGKSDEELDALARSYNVRPASELKKPGAPYTWDELFTAADIATGLLEAQQLILPSFAVAEHYDVYGIHLYDSMYGWRLARETNLVAAFLAPEGFQQAIQWISRQTPRKVWITGTGLWPNPTTSGDYTLSEQQEYNAGHVLKTITVAHATGVEWMTYSSIHQPGGYGTWADAMWWGLWPYDAASVEEGTAAAGTFTRMAELIPTASTVTRKKVIEYRNGTPTTVRVDADNPVRETLPGSDPWSGDPDFHTSALLYTFDLVATAPVDHLAVGWCMDQSPLEPESFELDPACGQIEDICQTLGLDENDPVTVYGVDGSLQKQETPCGQAGIAFEQEPFILTWNDAVLFVGRGNQPPVAQVVYLDMVPLQIEILLDASPSFDPDGDALDFHWAQEAGPELELTVDEDGSVQTLVEEPGSYSLTLRVTDGKSWSEMETVQFEGIDAAMECVPPPASTVKGAAATPSGILSVLIILSPGLFAIFQRRRAAHGRG